MTWTRKCLSETNPVMIQSKAVKKTEEEIQDLFA